MINESVKTLKHVAFFALAATTGCFAPVGPDYAEPDAPAPAGALPDAGAPTTNLTETCEYVTADASADERIEVSEYGIARWWERLNDPVLENLVKSAVSNNVSYLVAQKRLEQANWELLGTFSAFMPKMSVDGSATRSEIHRNNRNSTGLRHKEADVFNGGFNASWEIDMFGGNRRISEAALAQAQAAGWGVSQAWIELTAEIGRQYVLLRTVQERIYVARNNLILQSETYDILKSRLDSGIGDELAVNQCAYVVETTRARIPTLLTQEEALKNTIAILAGEKPGALSGILCEDRSRDWMLAPQKLAGMPLDMIRSRPDVSAAERQLAARVAQVGVAKSMWYPKFFISGGVGMESTQFSNFAQPGSFYASIGPSITWPVLQGGNVVAQVKAAEARVEEARLNYELVIDKAYAEVRDNYAAYTLEYHRYQALTSATKAATEAVAISKNLYQNGLRDFNNVLDAQRSRLNLEEELAVSRGQITIDLINLYRSLGGGLAADSTEAEEAQDTEEQENAKVESTPDEA